MLKVFVTGGIGNVGRATVQRLFEQGFAVRILDRRPEAEARAAEHAGMYAAAEYAQGDINDYPALLAHMTGCDRVIHLAALASPNMGTPEEVFRINAAGTFNIFQAAAALGIRRVSQASSINALGLYYGVKPAEPLYFPIDEAHPPQSTDAYSFSKWVVEEIAEFYWRREGISSVSLRFPAVLPQGAFSGPGRRFSARRDVMADLLAQLQAMSELERRAWLDERLEQARDLRARRVLEDPAVLRAMFTSPTPPIPRELFFFMVMRNNFWALVDERDSAQALVKGLTADFDGAHPLFINDAYNSAHVESELLLRLFFPDVITRKRPLVGDESLVSIDRARALIGFEPQFSFK